MSGISLRLIPCATGALRLATLVLAFVALRGALPTAAQPCDDGLRCTVEDMCVDEECRGSAIECPDDGNACTRELCSSATGTCVNQPVACDRACLTGECDPLTGCVPVPDGTTCDDRNPCTEEDTCGGGICRGRSVADGTPCEDALGPCTVDDTCLRGSCRGQFVVCPNLDGDACTPELCNFRTGECQSQARRICDGLCETGVCDRETGACPSIADSLPCDDGNVCTVRDGCLAGECRGGGAAEETPTQTATLTPPSTDTPTAVPSPTATPQPATTATPPPHSPTPPPATATATALAPATSTQSATTTPNQTATPSLPPTSSPTSPTDVLDDGCAAGPSNRRGDASALCLLAAALTLARCVRTRRRKLGS